MKTIAQQLNIKKFPFEIKDVNGNKVYWETSYGFWFKREYNTNSKEVYYEDSTGYWEKREYDTNGNCIYYEDSKGDIVDNRPKPVKEYSMDEIAKVMGIPVEQLKIRK